MSSQAPSPAEDGGGFLAPRPDRGPIDHCVRCGVETPPGVSLCAEHNPSRLRAPSATQMHATIFGGVALGVVLLFVLARAAISPAGPFAATVTAAATDAAGTLALTVSVTNQGSAEGSADCRITRDGVPRPDDATFRTQTLAAGVALSVVRRLLPEPDHPVPYDPETLTVICD